MTLLSGINGWLYKLTARNRWHFPSDPVVKTSPSNAGIVGSAPHLGTKISHASCQKNQNIKQKQYCNKFNKDFKNSQKKKKEKEMGCK